MKIKVVCVCVCVWVGGGGEGVLFRLRGRRRYAVWLSAVEHVDLAYWSLLLELHS